MMLHSSMEPILGRLVHGSQADKTGYSASAKQKMSDPTVLKYVVFVALILLISNSAQTETTKSSVNGFNINAFGKKYIVVIRRLAMPAQCLVEAIVKIMCRLSIWRTLFLLRHAVITSITQ